MAANEDVLEAEEQPESQEQGRKQIHWGRNSALEKLICFEHQSTRIQDLLLQQVRTNLDRKMTEEQTSKDEVTFAVVREQHEHPVHEVRWFLIPSQRKRN